MTTAARPNWFEIQMQGHPEAERAEEWARRCRSDNERDDIASEAMLRGLEALEKCQQSQPPQNTTKPDN